MSLTSLSTTVDGLTIRVLSCAKDLERSQSLTHVDAPEPAVLAVMVDVLRNRYALGAIHAAQGNPDVVVFARLFGLTSRGHELLERYAQGHGLPGEGGPFCAAVNVDDIGLPVA